ncbi:MAG: GerMN domain-containing protein [Lachnospiraceae bacterium]|nr:GerMN domain-containing protein [Lachnospiraceae bacterium]
MKAKKLLTMGMLVMAMALSACGSKEETKKEENVSAGETTVTPTEDTTPVETETPTPTEEPEVTETPVIEATATVAPKENEAEPKEEGITIYYGDENAEHILSTQIPKQKVTPELLVAELAKRDILTSDVTVKSFKETKKGNVKTLAVDFGEKFREILFSQGSSGEYIMMGSVVDTFLKAYGAESMTITVEGDMLESGHCIYDSEMTFYEPSSNDSAEKVSEGIADALGVE